MCVYFVSQTYVLQHLGDTGAAVLLFYGFISLFDVRFVFLFCQKPSYNTFNCCTVNQLKIQTDRLTGWLAGWLTISDHHCLLVKMQIEEKKTAVNMHNRFSFVFFATSIEKLKH